MTDISNQITGLSPRQLELLAQKLRERAKGGAPSQSIPRRESTAAAPLSFAQERLWFLQQWEPSGAAYHIPGAFRLVGRLDADALERALSEVVRRHEALRTAFPSEAGRPVQFITAPAPVALAVTDLAHLPEQEREAEARRLMRAEALLPFDLSEGPLLRASLLRLSPEEHILLCTMHHVVSDGWSMGVLVKEIGTLYEAFSAGLPSPLPDLPIQYADYASWQRERLQGETLEAELAYWRERLAGAPATLDLPADYTRPPSSSRRGTGLSFHLDVALAARLRALAHAEGATLFMALLGCWQVLLMRLSGSEDVVVGTPVAGRSRRELEGLVGFFVNTLVLRTDLSGDPPLAEVVRRARETCLGAYQHQDVPFERLVEELRPERSLGHSPLFQVMFSLGVTNAAAPRLGELRLEAISTAVAAAKFDLSMTLEETADGALAGTLTYSTDLFTEASARRLLAAYDRVLKAAAADASQKAWAIGLLGEDERQQALEAWNSTRREYPREHTIHELFEERAASQPEAAALEAGGRHVSYGELDAWSNRLARRLRRAGVGPESRVGLLAGRGWRTVAALLGILKAGGAYVPFDPRLPAQRIDFILRDAEIDVLITEQEYAARLPQPSRVTHLIRLDADWEAVAAESAAAVASGVGAQHLAYLIYTSGSTGQPKGVMIQHRSAINLLQGLKETVYAQHAGRSLRVSLNAPFSFDASMQQLLLLLDGHALFVVPQEVRADGAAMLEYLSRHEVEVLDCTPSHLGVLMAAGLLREGRHRPSLFLVAGEAMDAQMWQTLARVRGSKFFNIYGPTECTVDATSALVTEEAERPTIGRPLANTQLYVLDRSGEPAPVGVTGELYIGGDGLARGYLNRPTLTAERFVPDPFSRESGARLYRTGDLARYMADGQVEFVGRADDQVKIRGFRIELGEIEAALAAHEAVSDCCVLARRVDGDQRLIAYVVGADGAAPDAADLRAHLRARLPDYMVPAAFVTLERLPLTSNGKVDRRRLPEPGESSDAFSAYIAPRTPAEELVCGVWAKVLGVERVGVKADFFELGGHSLLATQVVARVRDAFGIELPLPALFEHPTAEGFAAYVERQRETGRRLERRPLLPVPRGAALPLSFAQQRLWFLQQLEPEGSAYNVPMAVRLTGWLDVEALNQTLTEIIRRHEVLRTTFSEVDGKPVQSIREPSPAALPLTDLSHLPEYEREAEARLIAEAEVLPPFDLSEGPLLRASLLRLSPEEHILLCTMHHVVSDGWSMGVLVREVGTLYEAFSAGLPSPLPDLPIQYADYASWQRERLQGETLEAELAYWRERLAGSPALLDLPTDRPRPAVSRHRGALLEFRVGAELTRRVKELSRAENATLFMTLLAAYYVWLHKYTGQDDIVVGTDISNRTRVETEDLIGCFFNLLPLRVDLSGAASFRDVLKRVREVTLGAYAHQDLPFEKLLEGLAAGRNAGRTPLFQVLFILRNAPAGALELPGLSLTQFGRDTQVSKFDLTLFVNEVGDELAAALEYDVELFEEATVERMVGHWRRILEEVVADPNGAFDSISLTTEEEGGELVSAFNDDLD